tara:strand:- start:129 stop:674 length:546 start_codon:yes stop_codon:yes gene_type:complete
MIVNDKIKTKIKNSMNIINTSFNDYDIFLLINITGLIVLLYDLFFSQSSYCFFKIKSILKKFEIIIIQYIHHWIQMFVILGWLFNNKSLLKIYLLSISFSLLHWIINDSNCILTEKFNNICNYPKNISFNDLYKILGLKNNKIWNSFGYYIYQFVIIMIVIYKLKTPRTKTKSKTKSKTKT